MQTLDYGEFSQVVEQKTQEFLSIVESKFDKQQLPLIHEALSVANHAHYKQLRKSGEPYIIHPIGVATIIASWSLDIPTIASALLHDVIEDTAITKQQLEQKFGADIAQLVNSLTKLDKLNFESEELAHAESFRKVVLAMAKDVRVILIKLADRMHNMFTLHHMRLAARKRIALETMEIYAPIANKIGLHRIYVQLSEESFKHLYPLRYRTLSRAVAHAHDKRAPIIKEILTNIERAIDSSNIKAKLIYRKRSIYNLYSRMKIRKQSFNHIYDIFEIKIIVETVGECYLILGVLHSAYQPIPTKFKDYIAIPKSNGYQSLHSVLMGPNGTPLQIHIRTSAMEEIAEDGIISHWIQQKDTPTKAIQDPTNPWLKNILDIEAGGFSANEFLNNIKQDLQPRDIYVFTPKGKIIILPKGSTTIDFAYFIHTNIGNHCTQAKVNQVLVPLNTQIKNGDIVEIITSPNSEPQENWLSFVVSVKAIHKIKQYRKEQKYDEDLSRGINLLNTAFKVLGSPIKADAKVLSQLINDYYPKMTTDELKYNLGTNQLNILKLAKQIISKGSEPKISEIKLSDFNGTTLIQHSNCLAMCGDTVLARLNTQGNIEIHKKTCATVKQSLENFTFVHIINNVGTQLLCKLQLQITNQPGALARVTNVIAESNLNLEELIVQNKVLLNNNVIINATLQVKTLADAQQLIESLTHKDLIINGRIT